MKRVSVPLETPQATPTATISMPLAQLQATPTTFEIEPNLRTRNRRTLARHEMAPGTTSGNHRLYISPGGEGRSHTTKPVSHQRVFLVVGGFWGKLYSLVADGDSLRQNDQGSLPGHGTGLHLLRPGQHSSVPHLVSHLPRPITSLGLS